MRYISIMIISALCLIMGITSATAQIDYTDTHVTVTPGFAVEVRVAEAASVTWYHIDLVEIHEDGKRTVSSLSEPLRAADMLTWIANWKAHALMREEELQRELDLLLNIEGALDTLAGELE